MLLCLQKIPSFCRRFRILRHVEKHGFGHGVVVSKVFYRILERAVVCHLPCYCNESRLSFSNSWWEVSLPAFQLPMFAKCEETCSTGLFKDSILHHAHPSVAAAEKNLSHAEKQRVWSQSCGLQDLLRNVPISDGSM